MARALTEMVIRYLKTLFWSDEFLAEARVCEKDFPRRRKLDFPDYVQMTVNRSSTSLADMIRRFKGTKTPGRSCSRQAYSQGRKRIRPEAFLELVRRSALFIQENAAELKKWHGLRVLAVDGSRINLPDSGESKAHFGFQKSTGEQVQGLFSGLFDVLNRIFVDARLAPCAASERDLALQHLQYLDAMQPPMRKSVILFDRGYPSGDLLSQIDELGFYYVMRCSAEFVKGMSLQGNDCVLTHKFVHTAEPVTLRVIRLPLADGTTEILVTNLFHKRYFLTAFKKLYHLRWGIETAYAFLKGRLEVENFSSVLPCGILQDMYGAIVLMNLLGSFALDLCRAHPLPEGKAIWWAEVIRLYKTCLFTLFRYKRVHPPFLEKLLLEASGFRVNVISGRSFERIIHHKTARFSQNNRGF